MIPKKMAIQLSKGDFSDSKASNASELPQATATFDLAQAQSQPLQPDQLGQRLKKIC